MRAVPRAYITRITNSADISWTPGLNDSIWNLRYGISGFVLSGVGTQLINLQNTLVNLNTLQSSTSYDVYVQSVCDSGYISSWNGPHSFTTAFTTGTCGAFTIELYDSWGDGWNGASITMTNYKASGGVQQNSISLSNGNSGTDSVATELGDSIIFSFISGSYDSEITFQVMDPAGDTVYNGGAPPL